VTASDLALRANEDVYRRLDQALTVGRLAGAPPRVLAGIARAMELVLEERKRLLSIEVHPDGTVCHHRAGHA